MNERHHDDELLATQSAWSAASGERRVAPSGFPGEFSTEPPGRGERDSICLGVELDLHHAQPGECSGVHVHFGNMSERAIECDSVASLVDPSPDGVRPQCLGLLERDRDVDFGSRDPGSCLHRERRSRRCDPDTNLHSVLLRQIPLAKVDTDSELPGRWGLEHDELPFDLDRHPISMRRSRYRRHMTPAATFHVAGHERTTIEALTDLGFVFDSPRSTTTTLLDTFDGRLHRADLRLQATESERVELELSGRGTAPAHVTVDAPPRLPADLPPGPFRTRVTALIDVRALLPRLRVGARQTHGVLRGAAGKVVVAAELHEGVHVIDRPEVDCPASTVEIYEVPGYAKQTDRAREALRAAGVEESETDTLTLCAAAAGVELAGFTATATVPLEPAMAAIDGFRLVLANLAATIDANWQGTIDQTDPEFLHDLRIAVRRSRVVLANAKRVLPAEILGKTCDELAWLSDLTSTPRDLDVYLLEWSKYTVPLGAEVAPLLEPVRDLLERRRTDVHGELERGLRSERAATLMNPWQDWLTDPPVGDLLPSRSGRPLGPLVAKRITRAHAILLERGRLIGPDTPAAQVHDLRKDAKRLRYLLECFGSLLPKRARKRYVKRLKALQDNLGEHQDAEVHVHMLRAVATELHDMGSSADTMVAIGQLTERLDQQRLAARVEFAERFADYDSPAALRALDAMLDGIGT
jgi:CHAD domain-containing protein